MRTLKQLPLAAAVAAVLAMRPGLLHAEAVPASGMDAAQACNAAGEAAERQHGVPEGLLRAIGRIESGRLDRRSGQVVPWPWAINAEGKGRLFEDRDDALVATRALQNAGTASVDVGCFQVNLMHHRAAFATLEEGFDPARNADYAARYLVALKQKTGSWEQAVAHYHSATPERGGPYRDKVLASWGGRAPDAGVPGAVVPVAVAIVAAPPPLVLRTVSWAPPAAGPGLRVWAPSAVGQGAAVIRMTRG